MAGYGGNYLANSFRRAAEMAVSQTLGVNPGIVRNATNGNWGRAAEIGIIQGTNKGIRHIQQEQRQYNNAERNYQRAEDRWEIMQGRHANRPEVLERERQRYEAAQERYKDVYQARHGEMPPGHKETQVPAARAPQPQSAAPVENMPRQTPVMQAVAPSPVQVPLPPPPAAEPVLTAVPEQTVITGRELPPEIQPMARFETPSSAQIQTAEIPAPIPAPAALALDRQETMQLQAGLNLMGIETGPIDGIAGPKTAKAIAEYTAQNPALAGANQQEILAHVRAEMQGNPDVQSAMSTIIAQGAQAETHAARAVQVALNDLGGADLDVDGAIGPQTARAFAGYMESSYASMTGEKAPQLAQNEVPAPAQSQPSQPQQQRVFNPVPGITI